MIESFRDCYLGKTAEMPGEGKGQDRGPPPAVDRDLYSLLWHAAPFAKARLFIAKNDASKGDAASKTPEGPLAVILLRYNEFKDHFGNGTFLLACDNPGPVGASQDTFRSSALRQNYVNPQLQGQLGEYGGILIKPDSAYDSPSRPWKPLEGEWLERCKRYGGDNARVLVYLTQEEENPDAPQAKRPARPPKQLSSGGAEQ